MCLSGLMGRERIHNPVGGRASARRDRGGGWSTKENGRKTWVWRRRTGGINRPFESIRQILFLRRLSMLSLTRKYCAVSFRARAETILLHATPRRERVPLISFERCSQPRNGRLWSITRYSAEEMIQWKDSRIFFFFFYFEYCFGKWMEIFVLYESMDSISIPKKFKTGKFREEKIATIF